MSGGLTAATTYPRRRADGQDQTCATADMCSRATTAAIASETPTTERPPTTEASQSTSRSSPDKLLSIFKLFQLIAHTRCERLSGYTVMWCANRRDGRRSRATVNSRERRLRVGRIARPQQAACGHLEISGSGAMCVPAGFPNAIPRARNCTKLLSSASREFAGRIRHHAGCGAGVERRR